MVRSSTCGVMMIEQKERVQVVVRCRPLSAEEIDSGYKSCVSVDTRQNTVGVFSNANCGTSKIFTFDHVYDATFTQQQLYKDVAHPIVQSVMCGYNGTIFAYGQTSSGKTFTMEGLDHPSDMRGIIPQAFEDIFDHIRQSQKSDHFLVRASYLEIYNEEIRDLLSPSTRHDERLELKESADSGVYVKNLASVTVNNISDIRHLLMIGKKNRSVGATLMNQDSSRSHSIFTITVETSSTSDVKYNNGSHIRVGKLNLALLELENLKAEKERSEEEKERIVSQLHQQLKELELENRALAKGKNDRTLLESKLRALEEKLLCGSNTDKELLLAKSRQQERELAHFQQQLQERQNLDGERQRKITELERFIPPEEVAKIMKRVHWDEDTETWMMKSPHHSINGSSGRPSQRPGSAVGRRRPTCQQTLNALAQGSTDPRYLEHNILKLEMDKTEKTTYNYEHPLERARAEAEILRGLSGHDKNIPSSYESRPTTRSKSTPRTRPVRK